MSKKLYPSDAASFLPTDDFPVPIIPTRKRLEPSRASLTSAATSSAAPSAEARAATRHRRAGRATGRARSAPVCARGAAAMAPLGDHRLSQAECVGRPPPPPRAPRGMAVMRRP